MTYTKPVPVPDALSQAFWAGAREHKLVIQRCGYCSRYAHPPVVVCQDCRNPQPRFAPAAVSGKGRILSWTIMRDSFIPSFKGDVPFAIGLVELAEQKGIRLIARLLDGPDAAYRLDAPVEVVFEDVAADTTLPQFRLAKESGR